VSTSPVPVERVLVTGGTGLLGRTVVASLRAREVPVRVLTRGLRSTPADGTDDRVEHVVGDLVTGEGLEAALDGVDVVVHCAQALGKLPEAAMGAGRPHVVHISIVGVDLIPFGYYRTKLAEEQRIAASGLRWSVLRATQFHDLVAGMLAAVTKPPVVLLPGGFRFQPVEAAEVGDRLAQLALAAPTGRVEELGGPEVRTLRDLTESALREWGRSRRIVELALPGGLARAMRAGRNLTPEHAHGAVTFEEYLRGLSAAGGRPYAGAMRSYLSWPAVRRHLPGRSAVTTRVPTQPR
jgi:uncharacterized protein YbjT (DUF2867 family)